MNQLARAHQKVGDYRAAAPLNRELHSMQARRLASTNDAVVSAASPLAVVLCEWAWHERGKGPGNSEAHEHAHESEHPNWGFSRFCVLARPGRIR